MVLPKISVVIPTRNRHYRLHECIQSIVASDYLRDQLEIIVVDDGSTDETASYLHQLIDAGLPIRALHLDGCGPATARNRGLAVSSGDLIAFTDDDCVVSGGWLCCLAESFADTTVDGVGGSVCAANDHLIARYMDFIRALDPPLQSDGHASYLVTANACFRRSALEHVGGFDETFLTAGGEDPELGVRMKKMGMTLLFVPGCRVDHWYAPSAVDFLRRYYRYGIGNRHINERHPTWPAWYPNADRQLHTWLSRGIKLRENGALTTAADRPWVYLLTLLQKVFCLAGYLHVTGEAQLLQSEQRGDPIAGSVRQPELLSRVPCRSRTEAILEALSTDRIDTSSAASSAQREARDWLAQHFQQALSSGMMDPWMQAIHGALDFDFIFDLVVPGMPVT